MSRTPLVDSLRRAIRFAAIEARRGPRTPPIDELIEMTYSRRRFLRDSAIVTAAAALGVSCGREAPPAGAGGSQSGTPAPGSKPGAPRIAIVGAGVAGLNAAY